MAEEVVLMKGNEAIAHAAIRCGADGYFGYPITPQSEVLETLAELKPWETTGMVVLQAESEVAAINMVYGGAGSGKMVLTSSSSPGVSLKQEGISYICLLYTSDAADDTPCVDLGGRRIIKKKFFQAEDGILDTDRSRGLGDVYKRQVHILCDIDAL